MASGVQMRHHPALPGHEVRVSAVVKGFEVTWRRTMGWRCRCGKTTRGDECRHVRAVKRELEPDVLDQIESLPETIGWSA